jgi:alpha-mannosidase
MSFVRDLDCAQQGLFGAEAGAKALLERFDAEVAFCAGLVQAHPSAEWEALILQAVAAVKAAVGNGQGAAAAVAEGERILAPLAPAAKAYTIHCGGHAHLDMNWMWSWPETVATVNDTFSTVDRLMDEFPDFHFSQSQASVYWILKDYLPELYARVKQRVAEGRWEVTASQWVEGDKNMASGEILCRHLLYTRRFFKEEFGLDYDAVTIDWEPDTFGHAHTLPGLLRSGKVRRYYHHRGRNRAPWLYWWQGKDGQRVLAFDDYIRAYNGVITAANLTGLLFEFEKQCGLKDFMFVFGVGDHGGGPTRRDLVNAVTMNTWPIFPNVKLSTTDAFYTIAEQQAQNLPVLDAEMNYILEGCYTAQSNIKRANRYSENALVEAEQYALLGRALAGQAYPAADLFTGWRHAMFNQFHDILPGSGVHATYEHAQGLFQEIMAITTMVKTRALRAIAARVNTLDTCGCGCPAGDGPGASIGASIGAGLGAGMGDVYGHGGLSRYGAGGTCCDSFVIFNPSAWARSEVLNVPLWHRDYPEGQIAVRDDAGNLYPAQFIERSGFWGHGNMIVALPVHDVPALGYRTYSVVRTPEPGTPANACTGNGRGVMENEFFRVVVDQESGALTSLVDKRTGLDLVPEGEVLGVLEYVLEAPHPMSSWIYGQPIKTQQFLEGGIMECPQNGPFLASVRTKHTLNDSTFTVTISLAAGVPRVDFTLEMNWLERGHDGHGVPTLRAVFPLNLADGTATFECANGFVTRPTDPTTLPSFTYDTLAGYTRATPHVVRYPLMTPAQKWVDLTGTQYGKGVGAAVLNESKYGYSVDGDTVRLDIIRSSYDPDPLPELGRHTVRFAVVPHDGAWTPADSTRAGYAFNMPFNVVNTGQHGGDLPARAGWMEVTPPNAILSGMKQAEDGDGLIVRLYEVEGKATTAQVRLDAALAPANAPVTVVNALEEPIDGAASLRDGVLTVDLPAAATVAVRIG